MLMFTNITEKDVLVIMCGTNDVARNDGGDLINKMNVCIYKKTSKTNK